MIPHNLPTLGALEIEAAGTVIASGWLAQGREVDAFEREMCEYLRLDAGHAVALSSGTAALFMALWALGAQGRRIAIPAYSCSALRNAVMMAGGLPVAIDVEPDSPNLDPEAAVTQGAAIAVAAHMFGIPCRIETDALSIPIIEDCAQAVGAQIDGRPVGTAGRVAVFSFYATKMITSGGQGGMLVSRDRNLVDLVRDYREFDCRPDRTARFNFQMTDLQAAIGRVQLRQLSRFLECRRNTYARYVSSGLPLWPRDVPTATQPCRFRAVLRTSNPQEVIDSLEAAGVRAIVPIADWELLGEADALPASRALAQTTVSIPIYPSLSRGEVDKIIGAVLTRLG